MISKIDKSKLSVIPRTNKESICVKYGCVKFLDSMRFQQQSVHKVTKCLNDQDYIHLKQQFLNLWMILKKKLALSYEYYKSL